MGPTAPLSCTWTVSETKGLNIEGLKLKIIIVRKNDKIKIIINFYNVCGLSFLGVFHFNY